MDKDKPAEVIVGYFDDEDNYMPLVCELHPATGVYEAVDAPGSDKLPSDILIELSAELAIMTKEEVA